MKKFFSDFQSSAIGYPSSVICHLLKGEVSERPKEHDWKSCFRREVERGFKSRPLRPFDCLSKILNTKENYVL
jgi:hypothetical protein